MPKLSVCMIVKDESENLKALLPQVESFADEIVIVDTGSKDNTKDIARRHTPNVYEFKWIDDFSAARNYALRLAHGDYFVWLDADDRIPPQSLTAINKLKNYFDGKKYFYFILKDIRNRGKFYGKSAYAFLKQIRCAPLRENVRFEGRIHESLNESLEKGEYIPVDTDIEIEHHGYDDKKLLKSKIRRNLKILLLEKPYKKSNVTFVFLLARTYQAIGMFKEAYEELNTFLHDYYSTVVEKYPHALFEFYISMAELAQRCYGSDITKRLLIKAGGCEREDKVVLFRLGMVCEKIEEYKRAVGYFLRIPDAPFSVSEFPSISPPPDWEVLLRMAFCWLCMNKYAEYEKCIELATVKGIARPLAYEWLGKHALYLGKNEISEKILLDAHSKGHGTSHTYALLGELFSVSGRYSDAESYLKQAVNMEPDANEIHLSLAWHYLRTGKIALAYEAFGEPTKYDYELSWEALVGKLICSFLLNKDWKEWLDKIKDDVGLGANESSPQHLLELLIIKLQSEGKAHLVPYASFILKKSF